MPALVARSIGKRFRRRDPDAPRTFRRFVEEGWRRRGGVHDEAFWALRGVSFAVEPGEMLGVVGRNGAGKSTLLRVLGDVMRPDEGTVEASAPVTGLLDLSAGMHPDLSGRENAVVAGVVQGLLRREVEARLDAILDFAELAPFAEAPVRTYSSGMKLRLGFAVLAHAEPRILLIDEVLAVGDLAFQTKCLERVRRFRAEGCAVVLISHDLEQVGRLCDRALWLSEGRLQAEGPAAAVAADFAAAMMAETARRAPAHAPAATTRGGVALVMGENRHGSLEVEIADVRLLDGQGRPIETLRPGGKLTVEVALTATAGARDVHVSVSMTGADGAPELDLNTAMSGQVLRVENGRTVSLVIDRVDLAPGRYGLSVGAWASDWSHALDLHDRVYDLEIRAAAGADGPLRPPHRWIVRE